MSPKKITNIRFSTQFIVAYCKDFNSLQLKDLITLQNPHQYGLLLIMNYRNLGLKGVAMKIFDEA